MNQKVEDNKEANHQEKNNSGQEKSSDNII